MVKLDKFVIAILITIAVGYIFPALGNNPSFPLNQIASVGVSLIFFFYGLKLSPAKLRAGLANWKLHLLVQCSTFILFPVLLLLAKPLFIGDFGQEWWLSFFFLAALPSTVSSSVVMVSLAKGNVPAAIFNASISGLIGIAVTPLWMGLFLQGEVADFDMSAIYFKLLIEILMPIILGLMLQRFIGFLAERYNKQLALFDKAIILLIIYKSFAEAFSMNVFSSLGWIQLLIVCLIVLALFYLVYYLVQSLSKWMGFSKEDEIAATFCGTKKSLVHGTVFSKILIPPSIPMGVILLPLMVFHAIQILVISMIATKLGNRK